MQPAEPLVEVKFINCRKMLGRYSENGAIDSSLSFISTPSPTLPHRPLLSVFFAPFHSLPVLKYSLNDKAKKKKPRWKRSESTLTTRIRTGFKTNVGCSAQRGCRCEREHGRRSSEDRRGRRRSGNASANPYATRGQSMDCKTF